MHNLLRCHSGVCQKPVNTIVYWMLEQVQHDDEGTCCPRQGYLAEFILSVAEGPEMTD